MDAIIEKHDWSYVRCISQITPKNVYLHLQKFTFSGLKYLKKSLFDFENKITAHVYFYLE